MVRNNTAISHDGTVAAADGRLEQAELIAPLRWRITESEQVGLMRRRPAAPVIIRLW